MCRGEGVHRAAGLDVGRLLKGDYSEESRRVARIVSREVPPPSTVIRRAIRLAAGAGRGAEGVRRRGDERRAGVGQAAERETCRRIGLIAHIVEVTWGQPLGGGAGDGDAVESASCLEMRSSPATASVVGRAYGPQCTDGVPQSCQASGETDHAFWLDSSGIGYHIRQLGDLKTERARPLPVRAPPQASYPCCQSHSVGVVVGHPTQVGGVSHIVGLR